MDVSVIDSRLERKLEALSFQLEECIDRDPVDIKKAVKIYHRYYHLLPGLYRPLQHAAKIGDSTAVKAFIECAKSLKKIQSSLIKWHAEGGIKDFLAHKNDKGNTALHEAAQNGHTDVIMNLVTEAPELLTIKNGDGKTPLSLLTEAGYDDIVFEILEKWAFVCFVEEQDTLATAITTAITTSSQPEDVITIEIDQDPSELTSPSHKKRTYEFENPMYVEDYRGPMMGSNFHYQNYVSEFSIKVTANKNTVLHIAAQFGRSKCVKDILAHRPSLLYQENSEGENALYVAARHGQLGAVKAIIDHVKDKISKENGDGFTESSTKRSTDDDTALLVAVRHHRIEVVFWLTKEVPRLSCLVNKAGVSPLYLAAEKGYEAIVKRITPTCDDEEQCCQGPYGQTALHAAVISNSPRTVEHLLSWKKELLEEEDVDHKTPFDYAVHLGHASVVEKLLSIEPSMGYKRFKNDDMTALHIAASRGDIEMMEVLISKSPGCWELTTRERRNILHIAVQYNQEKAVAFILKQPSLSCLINQKDNEGNTPLHLLVDSEYEIDTLIRHPAVDLYTYNNNNLTPLDVASKNGRKGRLQTIIAQNSQESLNPSKSKHKIEHPSVSMPAEDNYEDRIAKDALEMVNGLLLVATLIATATFAAGLAVPGGFDGNEGHKQGIPILLSKIAFKAFAISNALAFICSCSAIFGFIWLLFVNFRLRNDESQVDDFDRLIYRTTAIYSLIGIAMITMVIAFITGLYVVLQRELGLAISLCSVSSFILIFATLFAKTFSDIVYFVVDFVEETVTAWTRYLKKKFQLSRN